MRQFFPASSPSTRPGLVVRSGARHVDAEAAVADRSGEGPIVGDAHARVASDDALPLLACVTLPHIECLLSAHSIGEDDGAAGAGDLAHAFAGKADHVGMIESAVLRANGGPSADFHEDRQLVYGG